MISSFVITGFLGVGKSTMLINSVKKNFADKKVAIVVNEFGDVGVDGNVLSNVYSEVLEISEGCICCQLSEEFESGIQEIIGKYDPELIFVETSGASEPFPIFLSLQNLGISVEGVVCVIDSKNFDSYKDNSTAKYQVGGSNIIVLNKTDLVNENELEELKKEISGIKEKYNIRNTLTGKPIFNHFVLFESEYGTVNKEVFEGIYEPKELELISKDYKHKNHTAEDSITQKIAYLKEEIKFDDVDKVLNSLPKNIYRLKGIVKTIDVPNPIFINYSFGDSSFEEMPYYEGDSMLIFIGTQIDKDVIELSDKFDYVNVPRFTISK